MPGITLRKDGRYMIRKMINGIRKTIYANTLLDARKILSSFKKNKILIEQKTPAKKYTVSDWLNEWLVTYKKPFVKLSTYKDIEANTKKVITVLGDININELTTKTIQDYFNSLPVSRSKELMFLYFQNAIKKALELKILKNNVLVGLVKDKKIKNKRFAFNYAEQVKIVTELEQHPDIKVAIYFYLLTGARRNELIKSAKDIDFENNLITVRGTKTEKSEKRVIECTREFLTMLHKYLESNIFPSTDVISRAFNNMCKQIGIENANLHRLRHTFATNHYVLGTKAKQIQDWLGHESIETTMNIYTDLDKTLTRDKIIKLYNGLYYTKLN